MWNLRWPTSILLSPHLSTCRNTSLLMITSYGILVLSTLGPSQFPTLLPHDSRLSIYWHCFLIQPPPPCWGVARGCVTVPSLNLRVPKFTGSCWRSDVGGQTSPPPRHCKHHLMNAVTKRERVEDIWQQIGSVWGDWVWLCALTKCWCCTCMASKHVDSRPVVPTSAAHDVVLEIRLSHV